MPLEPAAPLETIAAAVRRERERVGISLTELARRAGVATSTLATGVGHRQSQRRDALGAGRRPRRAVQPAGGTRRRRHTGDPGRGRVPGAFRTGRLQRHPAQPARPICAGTST
ncbi:helix-turn-helix transcriptional regulator [Micromonospora sp. M12]